MQHQHIMKINLHLESLVSCHTGVTSYYISDYLEVVDVSDVSQYDTIIVNISPLNTCTARARIYTGNLSAGNTIRKMLM